ncbi:VOC family protein [Chloroflexi bacterium TSY]|nr:VOC family protein [Chloroflexi bacterium TSY]
MTTYLEHANITAPDIDAAIAFLKVIDPTFQVRHDATPEGSYRWTHIGNDHCYIALQAPHLDATPQDRQQPYKNYGVNHLLWVVDDLDAVVARLEAGGYRKGIPVDPHSAGLEWEIVQYLSDDPAERNQYA